MSLLLAQTVNAPVSWCPDLQNNQGQLRTSKQKLFEIVSGANFGGFGGYESELPPLRKSVAGQAGMVEVWPEELVIEGFGVYGAALPHPWKTACRKSLFFDTFSPLIKFEVCPWVEDFRDLHRSSLNHAAAICECWPPLIQTNKLLPGGYKPSSIFEGRSADYDFINRVELTITAIDDELASLAIETDVLEGEPEEVERSVVSGLKNYKFEPDIDYGVQLLVTNFLLRAEKQGTPIHESDVFLTSETARVNGHLIYEGTNAWILRVNREDRLDVAREAVAMGFKLISFDESSLSFVYAR